MRSSVLPGNRKAFLNRQATLSGCRHAINRSILYSGVRDAAELSPDPLRHTIVGVMPMAELHEPAAARPRDDAESNAHRLTELEHRR